MAALRSWLGLLGYYRRFIRHFSHYAAPLRALLKKDAQFLWKSEQQAAFSYLKDKLVTSPVLVYPDYTKSFHLDTDASKHGLGAILSQDHFGDSKPLYRVIAYASRSTTPGEKAYGATKLECSAVRWAVKHFRPYLYGRQFLLVTDHHALLWLSKMRGNALLQCWCLDLSEFDFTIQHRPGVQHINADALSRYPFCSAETYRTPIHINVLQFADLHGFSVPQLAQLQRQDSEIKVCLDYLDHQILPKDINAQRYVVILSDLLHQQHGLLWHVSPRRLRREDDPPHQLVVPRVLRLAVLQACHNDKTSGFGFSENI